MPDQIQACIDCGMQDVITKPINAALLYQKIIQLLQLDS
jgi:CheY-like chemotaxis protein